MSAEIKEFREKASELLDLAEGLDVKTRHEKRSVHEVIELLEKGIHSFEEKKMREFIKHEHRG